MKYTVAFESKVEKSSGEFKLQLHERATARGLDDPCKGTTPAFKTVKKKQRSAIPLEHGHLTNTRIRTKIATAATKLQNIWRGKKNREKSEHVARVRRFNRLRLWLPKQLRKELKRFSEQRAVDRCETTHGEARPASFRRERRKGSVVIGTRPCD